MKLDIYGKLMSPLFRYYRNYNGPCLQLFVFIWMSNDQQQLPLYLEVNAVSQRPARRWVYRYLRKHPHGTTGTLWLEKCDPRAAQSDTRVGVIATYTADYTDFPQDYKEKMNHGWRKTEPLTQPPHYSRCLPGNPHIVILGAV